LSEEQLEKDFRELKEKGICCEVKPEGNEVLCHTTDIVENKNNSHIVGSIRQALSIPKAEFKKETVEEFFGV
jgi:hypothetical protein